MLLLIAGLAVFFAAHSANIPRGLRAGLAAKLGETPFKLAYSALSAIGLAMIWFGYGEARRMGLAPLYTPPYWLGHLLLILMPISLVIFASAYTPTGRIKQTIKHPVVAAVKIWAFSHLLVNGEVQSVILFGAFLVWAVVDRISVAKREKAGLVTRPVAGSNALVGDLMAVAIGLGASAAFIFYLHAHLFGVAVWPA